MLYCIELSWNESRLISYGKQCSNRNIINKLASLKDDIIDKNQLEVLINNTYIDKYIINVYNYVMSFNNVLTYIRTYIYIESLSSYLSDETLTQHD